MHEYPRVWVIAAALATASTAWSGQPPTQVANLVEKLASAKYSERDFAARELKRIGEPALKPLQSALNSRDLELRSRAKAIIETIEARMINEKLIRASKISFKFVNKPLDEALAEMNKKTGLSLSLHPICRTSPKQLVNV